MVIDFEMLNYIITTIKKTDTWHYLLKLDNLMSSDFYLNYLIINYKLLVYIRACGPCYF